MGHQLKNINKAINLSLFDSISLIKGAYSINSRVEITPHNKTIIIPPNQNILLRIHKLYNLE